MSASTMTRAAVSAPYDRDTFEAHNGGGPDWLRAARAQAWETYEAAPLPNTRLEEWRYTDPSRLKWDKVRPASLASVAPVPSLRTRHQYPLSFASLIIVCTQTSVVMPVITR